MIRSLSGKVLDILDNIIILDVNGIGFEIFCSRSVLSSCEIGKAKTITTSLQISEAGAVIYGFTSEREREFFLRLTSVKGVGGRTAIAILSELSIDDVVNAISSADVNAFMRVPGIGKKTAERLCFELKNIAGLKVMSKKSEAVSKSSSGHAESVIDALLSLGFSRSDAGGVINLLRAAHGEDFNKISEEDLLRMSLRELHK
ncbi:MAG: Holliday junction branch migration protein RuvA [Synergistales bacterium]|nr:Holliday junction branch migration protein RuvA [Synergistales bacterium]MDY6401099.1 Holliday junction branch migration protein RuvA [Synergistales bacterium]MDY6404692.1 Holliday junction branch migration protein RuvA [Synergistales bacterium]MDY6410892.1 Holliday junction branch migration protein RuvA [Synergistales bacterium]MDY6415137.1 Holliday junction branch migration protein RuvA [Synergistales bacterium]